MNHDTDHDFHQFRGTFDSAITPDAEFKAKMEKLLKTERPMVAERTSSVLASPQKRPSESIMPARRSSPLMIAAAVLTVFAVVVASVWVLSGDVLEGEYASAPSGIATMPADAPGTPGPDVILTAEEFPNWHENDYLIGAYDGIMLSSRWIEQDTDPDAPTPIAVYSTIFTARDVSTGEILWEQSSMPSEVLDVVNGNIITLQYVQSQNEIENQRLTILDLATGEELRSQPIDFQPLNHGSRTSRPVVSDDHIILATGDGKAIAWSIESGDVAWETDFDAGEGWITNMSIGDGPSEEVAMIYVAAAVWQDQFVIVNGDGNLIVLDSTSGDIISEHAAAPLSGTDSRVVNQDLHAFSHGVLISRDVMGDGMVHELIAVNPESGDILWQRNLKGSAQISISEDGTIALNDHLWMRYPAFLRFFGLGGYSTFQFHWIDGSTGEDILTTNRGKLETSAVTLTDGTYACTRTEVREIVCFDRAGTRHILGIDLRSDPVLANGVIYVKSPNGWKTVRLP